MHTLIKLPGAKPDMPKMCRHGAFLLFAIGVRQHTGGIKSKSLSLPLAFLVRSNFQRESFHADKA